MPTLINPHKIKISLLPHSSVFSPIDHERRVTRGSEFSRMRIVDCQADCFSSKPVADVVSIATIQYDPDVLVQQIFQILERVGVNYISRLLGTMVDFVVSRRPVETDSERVLDNSLIQISDQQDDGRDVCIGRYTEAQKGQGATHIIMHIANERRIL